MARINNGKYYFWDYFLLLSIIAVTGFPFFYTLSEFILIGALISLIFFIIRKEKIDNAFILILLAFTAIDAIHFFTYENYSIRTLIGNPGRLIFAYMTVKILNGRFIKTYVNLIFYIALISLIFYALSFNQEFLNYMVDEIAPHFENPWYQETATFYKQQPNIIVYNFGMMSEGSYRNAGPFWEPGAFAIFLNIALILNLIIKGSLKNKESWLFIISILTTISTMGYVVLFFNLTIFYLFASRFRYKIITAIFLASVSIYLFNTLEFLKPKVEEDITLSETTTTSRFGSALADWKTFKENPFIGKGRIVSSKIYMIEMHRNNGLLNLMATYGIFISLLYFGLYIKSFKRICLYNHYPFSFAYFLLLSFLMMGFSQGIFMRPFFYTFLFLFVVYPANKKLQHHVSSIYNQPPHHLSSG